MEDRSSRDAEEVMFRLRSEAELVEPGVLGSEEVQDKFPGRKNRVCEVLRQERAWSVLGPEGHPEW